MSPFKVVYYPNCECHPLTLAKSLLVFDEITFFDHVSITMKTIGTVGHESRMRQVQPILQKEGYKINILNPQGGRVEDELKLIIDADLANEQYRKAFLKLVHVDPSFLIGMIPHGNYGEYGSAENLRKLILNLKDEDIPHSIDEMNSFEANIAPKPELLVALTMARDSHNLNLSSYLAMERGLQFFSDSEGMTTLLDAKLNDPSITSEQTNQTLAHQIAFTLLERLIPNEAFKGKTYVDIVKFRNKTEKDREKFKERILQLSSSIETSSIKSNQKEVQRLIDTELLPEAREYEYRLAESWDKFFQESTKAVIGDAAQISQFVQVTFLTQSLGAALLAGATRVGMKVFPHLIDYLKEKEAIGRRNPYSYLMRF